jgi:hypothetical protein
MIAEVPTRGTDRLERKLSLDAHLLIPRFVPDRNLRTQMLLIAQDLAAKHGCQLAPPKMPKPPMWRRVFGHVLSQQRRDGTEKDREDLKLPEDLGGESGGEGDLGPSCASEKPLTPARSIQECDELNTKLAAAAAVDGKNILPQYFLVPSADGTRGRPL